LDLRDLYPLPTGTGGPLSTSESPSLDAPLPTAGVGTSDDEAGRAVWVDLGGGQARTHPDLGAVRRHGVKWDVARWLVLGHNGSGHAAVGSGGSATAAAGRGDACRRLHGVA
jgi:hypothetical protein